jgi:uridine kinase
MQVTGFSRPSNPYIVGVAGGSGSGKTYFAKELRRELGAPSCELVYQDNFYIDQSKRFDFDGGSVNFDHPDAIDFELLADCLSELKKGQAVNIPIYDFATHSRKAKKLPVMPTPIILVDGILIFHSERVRALLDELIFFDTPEELRFQRRLERDVKERGRTPEGVRNQFMRQVKPMHDQFVAPSRCFAHTVVQDMGDYQNVLAAYLAKLQSLVKT